MFFSVRVLLSSPRFSHGRALSVAIHPCRACKRSFSIIKDNHNKQTAAIAPEFAFVSYIYKLLETRGRWEKLPPVAQYPVDGHDVAGPVPEWSRGLEHREG